MLDEDLLSLPYLSVPPVTSMGLVLAMGLSWARATLASFICYALLMAVENGYSTKFLTEAFFVLWLSQFMAWGVWTTFVWPHFVSPLRHLPQPRGGHWILGHGQRLTGNLPAAPLREWINEIDNNGVVRYLSFFNRERVLVCSPPALKEVLVSQAYNFQKPAAMRTLLGRTLGDGLLLAEGDQHKVQRKNLMPAFHVRHIKTLYPVFWEKACEVVQAMTIAYSDGFAVMDVHSWASRCTLDIIGLAGMGVTFGAIQDENSTLSSTYRKLATPSYQSKVLLLLGMMLPSRIISCLPLKRNEDINAAAQTIRNLCQDLIREKRQKLASKEQLDPDIISVALQSRQFTDEQLVDQVMTFLAAGHETTASALTWSLYQLSRYPEVQKRLRTEIRRSLHTIDAGLEISSVDIDRMPYLNAVCNEVLRTYSPIPQTIREAARDTEIQGQFIPKGTRITLAPWGINMDRRLWSYDAAEFKPERWLLSASGGAESNYAFMTFLHGPRSCIGSSFARAELACLLATWIGRFEFELEDETLVDERNLKFNTTVTLKPAYGMHLRTRVVEGW